MACVCCALDLGFRASVSRNVRGDWELGCGGCVLSLEESSSCIPAIASDDPRQGGMGNGDGDVRVSVGTGDIIGHTRVLREDMWDAVPEWWEEVQMPHTGGVPANVPFLYLVMSFMSPSGQ